MVYFDIVLKVPTSDKNFVHNIVFMGLHLQHRNTPYAVDYPRATVGTPNDTSRATRLVYANKGDVIRVFAQSLEDAHILVNLPVLKQIQEKDIAYVSNVLPVPTVATFVSLRKSANSRKLSKAETRRTSPDGTDLSVAMRKLVTEAHTLLHFNVYSKSSTREFSLDVEKSAVPAETIDTRAMSLKHTNSYGLSSESRVWLPSF